MNELKLQRRPIWLAIGCLQIALVIWLSLIPDPVSIPVINVSDKLQHALAYAVLMGWFGQLYQRPMMRLGYAFSFVLMGVVLEFAQGLSGQRAFEVADMFANTFGVLLAWIVLRRGGDQLLAWFERRVMGLAPTPGESPESR
ncbi:MAG: VanZ family protein [Proteobacteria bacterium]|nr:MAG: VanZ family protein [Pseudomonadota bacterium]QKK10440.1 MAG: VanZ family protein [Pseudomonadota bacterium]